VRVEVLVRLRQFCDLVSGLCDLVSGSAHDHRRRVRAAHGGSAGGGAIWPRRSAN